MSKILLNFVFMCAAVTVLPIGVDIPIFKDIFSQAIEESIVYTPTISFQSVFASADTIGCNISIEDVDLNVQPYYIYLVELNNASDEFLGGIEDSIKSIERVKITSPNISHSFTKYLSITGGKNIKGSTQYAIVVAGEDDKIVSKEIVKTQKFEYFVNVETKTNTDKTHKYLLIQPTANPKFNNFYYVYFELYNLTLDKLVGDYSIVNRDNLSSSWASFPVKLTEQVYEYELRLYCSSDHPEDLEYSTTFEKDEIKYYLVYVHDSTIKF